MCRSLKTPTKEIKKDLRLTSPHTSSSSAESVVAPAIGSTPGKCFPISVFVLVDASSHTAAAPHCRSFGACRQNPRCTTAVCSRLAALGQLAADQPACRLLESRHDGRGSLAWQTGQDAASSAESTGSCRRPHQCGSTKVAGRTPAEACTRGGVLGPASTVQRVSQVHHGDLCVAVDGRDCRVQLLVREPPEGHPKELVVPLERQGVVLAVQDHPNSLPNLFQVRVVAAKRYLVLGCVVEEWVVALAVAVVQQVVVDQVPAPGLGVRAQEGHVAGALERGLLGGDAHDGHRAQWAFPPHLPAVAARGEAQLPLGRVRALRHGVAVQREAVRLDVDVP
ncbi:unnamed protein product [Ixodes persulcatus]